MRGENLKGLAATTAGGLRPEAPATAALGGFFKAKEVVASPVAGTRARGLMCSGAGLPQVASTQKARKAKKTVTTTMRHWTKPPAREAAVGG
jgi:hypothetical protein